MATLARQAVGSNDLDTLQQIIQQREQLLGSLLNIGITANGNNMLVFDPDHIPDDNKLTTLVVVAGHPPAKPGSSLVCFGPTFVSGQIQSVAAYRAT